MRLAIERGLLAAGLCAVGLWAWSLARAALFQHRAEQVFEQQLALPPPAPAPSGAPPHAIVGRLLVPRLGLRAMVREGADNATLAVALGHIPGTALPGPAGNVGIAGHRDTFFRPLHRIRKADVIVLETLHGSYRYAVDDVRVVAPDDVAVLAPARSPRLTLVTCFPFDYVGPAPDRFVVQASLAGPGHATRPPSPPRRPRVLRARRRTAFHRRLLY